MKVISSSTSLLDLMVLLSLGDFFLYTSEKEIQQRTLPLVMLESHHENSLVWLLFGTKALIT